jgi:hypothetical protein
MKKAIVFAASVLFVTGLLFGQGMDFGGFGGGFPGGSLPGGGSNKARDKADDAMDKMEGRIPMRFFDALDRKPIPGATVEIPNRGSYTTNSQGKIAFPKIPDGNYTLIFSKDGYITTPIDFRVLLGAVDINNWYSVSPGFSGKDYRIVLEWAEKPADLDLHFVKTGGSGPYHISYLDMKRADDGNAVLDRDDLAGYGPETITIGRIEANAVYTCYVHDYTNGNNPNSTQMAKEGAVIRVYSANRLINTFRIPADGKGARWNVFRIERSGVVPVNTVTGN